MKPVLVLDIGGTIGSSWNEHGALGHGERSSAGLETTVSGDAVWRDFGGFLSAGRRIDSCDMHPSDWEKLARHIADQQGSCSAIVILHGTDTMAFTASALAYALGNAGVPVILTGSQKSHVEEGSDSRANLGLAINTARGAHGDFSGEVLIAFGGKLHRGVRATKTSTHRADAFSSPGLPAIDPAVDCKSAAAAWCRSRPSKRLVPHIGFEPAIWIADVWPGLSGERLERTLAAADARGVVLRLFGVGAAPATAELSRICSKLDDLRIPCLAISSIAGATLDWRRYEATRVLQDSPMIDGGSMTIEAAAAKMMWVLSGTGDYDERRGLLAANVAGERDVA